MNVDHFLHIGLHDPLCLRHSRLGGAELRAALAARYAEAGDGLMVGIRAWRPVWILVEQCADGATSLTLYRANYVVVMLQLRHKGLDRPCHLLEKGEGRL